MKGGYVPRQQADEVVEAAAKALAASGLVMTRHARTLRAAAPSVSERREMAGQLLSLADAQARFARALLALTK